MRPAIAAAAWSAIALVVVWIIGVGAMQLLMNRASGGETFGAIVVALPVALLLFVLAPLIAGFVGGIVSHRIHAVAGSLIGVLVVGLLAVVVSGGPSDGTSGFGGAAAVGAVLVAAGHMTGVAIRPRASAT
jgi:hypothetical protein